MKKFASKLTTENQMTIPRQIREILDLSRGGSLIFEIGKNKNFFVRKAIPVNYEYIRALEGTLSE